MSSSSSVPVVLDKPWLSKNYSRWNQNHPMPPSRQKELIEEYITTLPPLTNRCIRATQVESSDKLVKRDERVKLAPSLILPSLTGVYVHGTKRWKPKSLLLDYKGWILTQKEYENFGYAVHTAVQLPHIFDSLINFILLGKIIEFKLRFV